MLKKNENDLFLEKLFKNKMTEIVYGFISIVLSIFIWGSYAVPLKKQSVVKANIEPIIIQIYYSISIFVLSQFILFLTPFPKDFNILLAGSASGFIWSVSNTCAVSAIKRIGISASLSIWAGITILVTFLWGVLIFPDENNIKNYFVAVLAIILLIIGVIGISLSSWEKEHLFSHNENFQKKYIIGISYAITMGILNGSLWVPIQFFKVENLDLSETLSLFLPFGVIAIIASPIIASMFFLVKRQVPQFKLRETFGWVFLSGMLWFLGAFCAVQSIYFVGLSLGGTLPNLALIINSIWGIFVFKEIKGKIRLIIWMQFLIIVLGGAIMLSFVMN